MALFIFAHSVVHDPRTSSDFSSRLRWLSGIHDCLSYPARKRGEERGVYGLVGRLERKGRELQLVADSGEWSQVKGKKTLSAEQIRKTLSAGTTELLETALYPGVDAIYQILSENF